MILILQGSMQFNRDGVSSTRLLRNAWGSSFQNMSHRETLFFHRNYKTVKTLSQTSSYIFWNKFQISSPLRATVKFTHPKILTVMVVQHALTNPDGWEELYYFRFHFGILAVVPGERNEYFILSKFHIAFITNFNFGCMYITLTRTIIILMIFFQYLL